MNQSHRLQAGERPAGQRPDCGGSLPSATGSPTETLMAPAVEVESGGGCLDAL